MRALWESGDPRRRRGDPLPLVLYSKCLELSLSCFCDRFLDILKILWPFFWKIVNCLFVFHCILWHSEMHCWQNFSLDLFSLHYYHFLLLCTVLMLIGTIRIVILLFSIYLFKYGSVLNWFDHELIPISERFVFSTYLFLLLLLCIAILYWLLLLPFWDRNQFTNQSTQYGSVLSWLVHELISERQQ